MIEINLVPENLRKKKRSKKSSGRGFALPKVAVVGMIGGFILLLALIHIALQVFVAVKATNYKDLKNEWEEIAPEKQNADVVIAEFRAIQSKLKAVQEVTEGKKVLWAQKLDEISNAVPRGVWLTEVTLIDGSLYIHGSSVSKDNAEILSVHKFASNLKDNKNFKKYFNDIEMAIHKTNKIGSTSIADFSIDAVLEK